MTEHRVVRSSEHYYLSLIPAAITEQLRVRYANAKRKYHTWQHVQEMFDILELVDERVACLPAVVLAVLFHDSVMDFRRKDNEVRSAALLRKLAGKMEPYWLERAEAMILATADHQLPEGCDGTSDEAYFLDVDLSILAASKSRYREYTQQVRQEYKHVPEEEFRAGRAAVLRGFLERGSVYFTEWGQVMLERRARENMQRELEELEGEQVPQA